MLLYCLVHKDNKEIAYKVLWRLSLHKITKGGCEGCMCVWGGGVSQIFCFGTAGSVCLGEGNFVLVCHVLTARSPYVMKCQREITPTPLLVFSARLPAGWELSWGPFVWNIFGVGVQSGKTLRQACFSSLHFLISSFDLFAVLCRGCRPFAHSVKLTANVPVCFGSLLCLSTSPKSSSVERSCCTCVYLPACHLIAVCLSASLPSSLCILPFSFKVGSETVSGAATCATHRWFRT